MPFFKKISIILMFLRKIRCVVETSAEKQASNLSPRCLIQTPVSQTSNLLPVCLQERRPRLTIRV